MKTLNLTVFCRAVYNSHIEVPDDMEIDEALEYAKAHLNDVPMCSPLEYIDGSDELDEDNCDFDD